MNKKNKFTRALSFIETTKTKMYFMYLALCSFLISMRINGAFAKNTDEKTTTTTTEPDGTNIADTALDWVGTLAFLPGIFLLATGFIKYGSAHSDGDGPAEKKAIQTIIAGVMIILVAVAVKNLPISNYLKLDGAAMK